MEFYRQPQIFYSAEVKICPLKQLKKTPMWGRSILQRLEFRRQIATIAKVEVPEGARKEAGLQHHFRIDAIIETLNIPKSLVRNSD